MLPRDAWSPCLVRVVKGVSLVKKHFKRPNQCDLSLSGPSANRSQQLVEESSHHRGRLHDQISAEGRQFQLKGTCVVRVIRSLEQPGLLQRTH